VLTVLARLTLLAELTLLAVLGGLQIEPVHRLPEPCRRPDPVCPC
jgi:hypothetical protein